MRKKSCLSAETPKIEVFYQWYLTAITGTSSDKDFIIP